ncbi:MAG TPA: histidine phosphatase family protein [Anaerolineae bacterium]|nr:histidine phosphatase family protein [Anaerolineae bacterium]
MAKRILYLVRHGQQDSKHTPADDLGGRLTALGRQQAALTARRLAQLPIRAIHHSDLRRAAETASIIARKFQEAPLRQSRRLRECIPTIPWAFSEYFAELPATALARDQRQAESVFKTHFRAARSDERHEVVVCHGNLIRYLVCRALCVPPEAWMNLDICNCGISIVSIEPKRMVLIAHNDVGHLPPALTTFI